MRIAARTDAGVVREVNEDYVLVDDAQGLVVVVDGQGGLVTGVLAAQLAAVGLRFALRGAHGHGDPQTSLQQALRDVDRIVFDAAQSEGKSLDAPLVKALDESAMSVLEMAHCSRRPHDRSGCRGRNSRRGCRRIAGEG